MADVPILTLTDQPSPTLNDTALETQHATRGSERIFLDRLTGQNVVIVNSVGDFPAAAAGVVTLATDTAYLVGTNFSMSDRIDVGVRTALIGFTPRVSKITYTGTGVFLTVTDTTFNTDQMGFNCALGTFMNADSGGLASQFVVLASTNVTSCVKLGTFTDIGVTFETFVSAAHDDGFSFVNAISFLFGERMFLLDSDAGSIALDLGTATFGTFSINRSDFLGTGIGISGAAASANIDANKIADLLNVEFNNITTPLSGISREDFRWSFKSCAGILSSHRLAETDLTILKTVTISSSGVFVRVAGTNWSDNKSESFTIDTDGEVHYIGEIEREFKVTVAATIAKVGGGANEICARIGLDTGSGYVTETRTESCSENATATTVFSQGTFVLQKDDTLALFVANQDATANIEVSVSSFIVTEIV